MFSGDDRLCISVVVNADVTQLVESQPSKLLVAGSNPVVRSKIRVIKIKITLTVF